MLLYKQISDNNRVKYGTEAERILKIIINQYSDRTHFIYEILQNAEDAGATYIKFHLEKERLVILHNGRPFNEKDIEGVCGIANGTKEDGTRIGHFGIGFKSVYCYTEQPEIYSGEYCFVIKNQLFPCEIEKKLDLTNDQTCMILPFDKDEVPVHIAYQEIKDALIKKINAQSIVMLNNISNIEIAIDGHPEQIIIDKAKYSIGKGSYAENVFSLSLHTTIMNHLTNKERISDGDYLFFTDAEKEATAIIFKVEGRELKPIKNSKIYAFFPTAKEAHQNFYIHAPFDTTPARDNFKEGAEYGKHNIELIKAIGELIWFAFRWMKDNHYLSAAGMNMVFPIYEYEEDDILYDIYRNSIDIIREEAILPTSSGKFKRINEIAVPLWGIIVDTFDEDDLRYLKHDRKISWLAKEFSTEAYSDLRKFLNKNFQLETLDWKDLVKNIDAIFLKSKERSWMEELLSRIENYCVKKSINDSHYIDVSHVPFVRTVRGDQICARDASGKLQVYLNNPEVANYKIESTFLQSESIRSFYQRALQIPEYNVEQETIENILPKYVTKDVKFRTNNPIKENIDDLKIIKDAIDTTHSGIVEQLKDKYIVTDGKEWYCPNELYIKSEDSRLGYDLVKNIVNIHYLADSYMNGSLYTLNLDENFFRKIGCNFGIRQIHTEKEEYLKAVARYIGKQEAMDLRYAIFGKKNISGRVEWGFNYEGFPRVFENMTREKSLAIARFLNPNAMSFEIQGELVGADDRQFSGRNVDSKMAYSMLGMQLCFEKWIYVKDDEKPHSPMEIDREDIIPEYKFAKRLMAMLPFKEVKNGLTEWLDANIKDKNDLDMIKHFLASPDRLKQAAEAAAREAAREEKRKEKARSARELIEQGDREQKEVAGKSDLEVTPISEKGKKKREEYYDRELAASLDEYTYVAKGLTFARHASNEEERLFLEQEYDGHCQICLKQICKYNGDHYFEAINIMKYSQLPERLQNSSKYGWNSLCLCPNCAAEYNYCSKKISTLYEQVMENDAEAGSDETIDILVEIPQGKARRIHYSPRHFLALKSALKIFADEE